MDSIKGISMMSLTRYLVSISYQSVAPVCNPTLQVIGLQISCMENAGVAVDALQNKSKIKILIHTFFPLKQIYIHQH